MQPQSSSSARVSTLELFFDLVFVFTITQVSELVLHAQSWLGIVQAFLVLTITWWMYGGYAWLTNNVGTDVLLNRILVLIGMAGFLVMALATPHVFDGDGVTFGLAYLLVNVIHAALFTRAPQQSSARAIWTIAPFNVGTALLVTLAGVLPQWNLVLWCVAVGVLAAVPFFGKVSGFALQPAHFVERHGLVMIIALGESIVSIGVGAAGEPLTLRLILTALLALALNVAVWWSYFARDDQRAEHALTHADEANRSRMALYAYGYGHLLMIAGVVLLAAGLKELIAHLEASISARSAILLGCGVALYLLGDVIFRATLQIRANQMRVLMIAVSLACVAVGLWLNGSAELVALLVVLVAVVLFEHNMLAKSAEIAAS